MNTGFLWPLVFVIGAGITGAIVGYHLGPAFLALVLMLWVLAWFVSKW